MGVQTSLTVEKGSLAAIHTGGSLPEGADAVVMLEGTERDGEWIRVRQAVKPGDNLIEVGEDIRGGAEVIPKGHRLREPDIGGLLALGFTEVDVVRQARIAVFASGDEVVAPGSATGPGQVRDINSYTIAAQAHSAGAVPLRGDILPDRFDVAFAAVNNAYQQGADMIVMSAGSSVSDRDQTPDIFNALGEPGVLIHGLATRPGKPTLLGMAGRVPLIGLPGNPVSAMVQFLMNAVPVIYALHGAALPPSAMVRVRLDGEIKSADWREDYLPARLIQRDGETLAKPLYFKSNLIFSMVHAHGLVKVPIGTGDVGAGEWVEMRLF
jgi:molybdopterin molybdotransferase